MYCPLLRWPRTMGRQREKGARHFPRWILPWATAWLERQRGKRVSSLPQDGTPWLTTCSGRWRGWIKEMADKKAFLEKQELMQQFQGQTKACQCNKRLTLPPATCGTLLVFVLMLGRGKTRLLVPVQGNLGPGTGSTFAPNGGCKFTQKKVSN